MSDLGESASFPHSAKLNCHRPPAVGKEVTNFHEESFFNFLGSQKHNMEQPESVYNDSCSEKTSMYLEGSPNPSPISAYKWAQSLQCLLEDINGVTLFQKFVKQQGHDRKCLDFLFACRGVKKIDPSDKKNLHELINRLYKRNVRRISAISQETKDEIARKLSANKGVDINILDDAQLEVEAYLQKTTYPNFLSSDIYIQLLGDNEIRECTVSPEPSDLPTVCEDSVLNIPVNKIPLTKENFLHRWRTSMKSKVEEQQSGSYLKSPYSYSSYHTKYAPFLPTSAQDSELQSLSSDARSEDTSSLADSTIDFTQRYKDNQKKHHKSRHNYGILNRDILSHTNFIPRTQRLPEAQTKTPQEFHALLVKKLNKIAEDQKINEKLSEKLKSVEGESAKPDIPVSKPPKPNSESSFDSGFLMRSSEDNAQDILDQHVSSVFQDSGLTPTLSPGCVSPPATCTSGEESRMRLISSGHCDVSLVQQDFSNSSSQKGGSRGKRDIKSRSNDSGSVCKWVSEDNLWETPSCSDDQHTGGKRNRDQPKRYPRKLSHADSRSLYDSGISVACESTLQASHSSSNRKAITQACSRWMENSQGPLQPIVQDMMMPALPPPDTTTNLLEARRRLEENESRTRFSRTSGRSSHDISKGKPTYRAPADCFKDGVSHRKQSKRSSDTSSGNSTCNEETLVGYSFGRHAAPFSRRLPGKNITLGQFKFFLNKPGNFRYFFKKVCNDFGTGVVFEEVTDDLEVLPLWEGKVFCVIDSLDENPATNSEFSQRQNKF